MALQDQLPVSYLLFTSRGRMNRLTYWVASALIWSAFYVLFNILQGAFGWSATWILFPVLFWALLCTAIKRLHDSDLSGHLLWLILVPVVGPVLLTVLLGFKSGSALRNRFGAVPGSAPGYFTNPEAYAIQHLKSDERIVNDVTQINPVLVAKVVAPETIEELQTLIRDAQGPVSIGGGRFSMGGQTASPHSLHIDMRRLNKVLDFSATDKIIKVQAGTRWCDIQQYVDAHNLSVKIMQTYANFTVGGSLSVNVHGRYIGEGPVILSVRSIDIIPATGELMTASRLQNAELFNACIGCYNAVAVIAAVELELEENVAVKRIHTKMKIGGYKDFFFAQVRQNPQVVFHNGDIYPPLYKNVHAVSWLKTDKKPTEKTRLMPLAAAYPLERYFIGAFTRTDFAKWLREYVIDPLTYASEKIHWRNYEAGYDVWELEPESRAKATYVLQEYFVPVELFDAFVVPMAEIFTRHKVDVINVSIRHAKADTGSLIAWAKTEVFAFVVWYKQGTTDADKNKVAVWTRELIDLAAALNGSYYLPYQAHATPAQFHKAYPNAHKLFEVKKKLDPHFKFRNVLWDTYYKNEQL